MVRGWHPVRVPEGVENGRWSVSLWGDDGFWVVPQSSGSTMPMLPESQWQYGEG